MEAQLNVKAILRFNTHIQVIAQLEAKGVLQVANVCTALIINRAFS